MIMFNFWLDYKVFPYEKIQSIISPLCHYYEILVCFNILLSELKPLPNTFSSDLHITDLETPSKNFKVQLEMYLSNL